MREGFCRPELLVKAEESAPKRRRTARIHASGSQFQKTLVKMDTGGMLELERVQYFRDAGESRGYIQHIPPDCEAGMFAILKDAIMQRLITSRCKANDQEATFGASRYLFPHGTIFCEIVMKVDEFLQGSVMDLLILVTNFYHTCGVSRARALRNQLGRPKPLRWFREAFERSGGGALSRLEAREGPLADDELVVPLQTTLPMGDTNATEFAEVGHINLLRTFGAAGPDVLATYKAPFPRGAVSQSVMIDDNVVCEVKRRPRLRGRRIGPRYTCRAPVHPSAAPRASDVARPFALEKGGAVGVPRSSAFDSSAEQSKSGSAECSKAGDSRQSERVDTPSAEMLVQASLDAYEHAGLPPKPEKCRLFSPDFEALGARVARGWVSAKGAHLASVLVLLAAALESGRATEPLLATLLALLVHCMLFRREAFCLLERSFQWLSKLREGSRSGRWPPDVRDE